MTTRLRLLTQLLMAVFFSWVSATANTQETSSLKVARDQLQAFDSIVDAAAHDYIRHEWSRLRIIINDDESGPFEPLQIDEYQISLQTVYAGLTQSGSITPLRWNNVSRSMELVLADRFKRTARELLNHVNDPNYSGIYSDAIRSNVEQLWLSSRKLEEENIAAGLGELLNVLKSLVVPPRSQAESYYDNSRNELQAMVNLLAALHRNRASTIDTLPGVITVGSLVARIEECEIGMIRGWVYSSETPDRPVAVAITVNQNKYLVTANRPARGVPELIYLNQPNHGFVLDYFDFETGQNLVTIQATDPASGQLVTLARLELLAGN